MKGLTDLQSNTYQHILKRCLKSTKEWCSVVRRPCCWEGKDMRGLLYEVDLIPLHYGELASRGLQLLAGHHVGLLTVYPPLPLLPSSAQFLMRIKS